MFNKFPSISGFHSMRADVIQHVGGAKYRGKVKLHGTCSGVVVTGNQVFAQSKERLLTSDDDNYKFAAWVESQSTEWLSAVTKSGLPVTVFGEWCGKGIQKKVAISKIDRKVFCIFAVTIGDPGEKNYSDYINIDMITDPDEIAEVVDVSGLEDVYILPWATKEFQVNFNDRDELIEIIEDINGAVEKVERLDPWVKEVFEVDGIGEGLVFVPTEQIYRNRFYYSKLSFKAKGEEHRGTRSDKAVQIDPEVAKSIEEFVDLVVTEARLEQGIREVNGGEYVFNMKALGPFMGWVCKDVNKETKAELEAAELEWNQVKHSVQNRVRQWFIERHNTL